MLNETNKAESFFLINRKSEPVRIIRIGDRLYNLYVNRAPKSLPDECALLAMLLHGEIFFAT